LKYFAILEKNTTSLEKNLQKLLERVAAMKTARSGAPAVPAGRAWWAVSVFTVAALLSYTDRPISASAIHK
jgi:hypothetical protein